MDIIIAFLQEYIVLLVMGVCLCAGYVLKNLVPVDKLNKFIPLIMAVLGVIINAWVNAWAFTPVILLGGLSSGLASTGAYEAVKHLFELKSK